MEKRFTGFLRFKRFNGIKAGRSIWREFTLQTRVYPDKESVCSELRWLVDVVVPATGVKIVGYFIDSFLDFDDNYPF